MLHDVDVVQMPMENSDHSNIVEPNDLSKWDMFSKVYTVEMIDVQSSVSD